MRYVFSFGLALALGLALMAGCSDENGDGGSGGTAGTGGEGGTGGIDLCLAVNCEDDGNECTGDGVCDPADGMCDYTLLEDGTACSEGECLDGVCAPIGAFPCTEQGIRDAIAEGGGPHFFACDGPTTVVTEDEIVINKDVILDGEGNLTVDGNQTVDRIQDLRALFSVATNITAELRGFTVSGGASLEGGGLYVYNGGSLSLIDSTVSGNLLNAVYNEGTLTLMNSTVSDNWGLGPGINNYGTATLTNSTVSDNEAAEGIHNDWLGTLTVMNSTVSGNSAGGISNGGTLTVMNSTVSGNTGPGIYNFGTATLTNSTVSDNKGGIFNNNYYLATVTLTNSLIDGECTFALVASAGYNIESPGNTCGFDQDTDQVEVTAEQLNLGPLQDNGGPTMTHALGAGSVAIDQIPAEDCVDADGAPLTTDQRGVARPQGDSCDVGAFELEVAP